MIIVFKQHRIEIYEPVQMFDSARILDIPPTHRNAYRRGDKGSLLSPE